MRRPVNSPYRITTKYGRVKGYPLNNGFHKGVDYVSDDKKILAPQNGTVTTGYDEINGNYMIITSGKYRHWFSHISRYRVRSGTVKQGQWVAIMGRTGYATGVHLHWSLRVNGVMKNPEDYVKGDDMADSEDVRYIYKYGPLRRAADKNGLKHYTGKKTSTIIKEHKNSAEGKKVAARLSTNAKLAKQVPGLKQQIIKLKQENAKLATKVQEGSKWEQFKALIRDLIGSK